MAKKKLKTKKSILEKIKEKDYKKYGDILTIKSCDIKCLYLILKDKLPKPQKQEVKKRGEKGGKKK